MCVGHTIGKQSFVHEDVASNQLRAEEVADLLDYSGEVGNVVLSTPGFMPTTGNSAPAKNAAAAYYSLASAPADAAFSCLELQQATAVVGMCKADRFVADEAEEAVKGEKRGRGEEGERG